MGRSRWQAWVLIVLILPVLPGCHVLVRLGEEPGAKQQLGEPSEEEPGEDDTLRPLPAPNSRPEIPGPPPADIFTSAANQRTSSFRSVGTTRRRSKEKIGNTGINFQTALSPGEDQYVYRTQLRFLQSHSSPGPTEANVNVLANLHVLAYGLSEKWTLFGLVPLIKRDGTVRPATPAGAFTEIQDFGVADMQFFAKYRFWTEDKAAETTRWSVFGGLEVPTYEKNISSDSWDPFIGAVRTFQSLDWGLDYDLGWKFNTGKDAFRADELFYDLAYTYVLLRGQTIEEEFWQLQSVFELNGSYLTDGSHLLFAAPGFQLVRQRIIVEASLQLPAIRDLKNSIEPDYVFAVGTRITW